MENQNINKKEFETVEEKLNRLVKSVYGANMQIISIAELPQLKSILRNKDNSAASLTKNLQVEGEKVVTKEEPTKTTTDNKNKNVEIISGQFKGFKGIIKEDCVLIDKYLIQLDEFNAIYADKKDVKIAEDEWKDIPLNGYNTCSFDEYAILIHKDCIEIIGTQNIGKFNEYTYVKKVEDMEIVKACVKNIKSNKEKVVSYLLNSLLRDKYYKEYHRVSDEFKKARHNRTILRNNIENNTSVIKSLEKGLGI